MYCCLLRLFLILFTICNLTGNVVLGQTHASEPDFVESFEVMLRKAKSFYNTNPDSIILFGNKALDFAIAQKYLKGQAEAYNALGVGYKEKGLLGPSVEVLRKGIEIAAENGYDEIHATLLLNKGNSDEGLANYITALDDYLKSIELKEKLGDKMGVAKCLNNIAQIYSRQGKNKDAIDYFRKSLAIKLTFSDTVSIAKTYNNMGVSFINDAAYDSALFYLSKAAFGYSASGDMGMVATATGNIGLTYDLMGIKDTALVYYLKSLSYLEDSDEYYDIAVTSINIGSLYLDKGDLENAGKYIKKGLDLGLQINSKEDIKEGYKYLAEWYSRKGDYKNAFSYQQKFQVISDSLLNEEKAAQLTEMLVKYESSRKDEENKLLQKENEIQKILLDRNRYINIGLGILLVLLVVISWLMFKQAKLKSKQQEMELEQRLLRSQMNPHFIFNSLQAIQSYIFENSPIEAGKYLADFSRLIRLILENSTSETIPLSKEIETLKYYLSLQKLRFSEKLDYTLEVSEGKGIEFIQIPPMLMQPFIENSIEHGIRMKDGKGSVKVKIDISDNAILLRVSDDGIGRKKAAELESGNNGHKSLAMEITHDRLEIFNRKWKKKSKLRIIDLPENAGTIVEIDLPL
ncbi:MAG: tetratricopeptide repeat protein [Bacteroidetes bacterium]|nr:tetratricopeptide repeat protein [Bacteroidota bacterium]